MVAGAVPDTAGARGSRCVISWHTREDPTAAAGAAQLGRARAAFGIPGCAPAVPRRRARGRSRFGRRGNRHGPAGKGLAFLMATQQLGMWLNCSAVAKEPPRSQETDGYAQ